MLSEKKQGEGYALLKEIIHEITDDRNTTTVHGDFFVEASVDGTSVLSGTVRCHFGIDHHNGRISVYWEEAGFPNYKTAGLFGQMSTNYQELKRLNGGVLRIIGTSPEYIVHINYMS